jgi:hypothetical protein
MFSVKEYCYVDFVVVESIVMFYHAKRLLPFFSGISW